MNTKRLWLVLALLFPALAIAQKDPDLPLGKAVHIRALICTNREAAIKLADTYVNEGFQSMRKVLDGYISTSACSTGFFTIVFNGKIYRVEGVHGMMVVFRGVIARVPGMTVYAPVDEVVDLPSGEPGSFKCPPDTVCT